MSKSKAIEMLDRMGFDPHLAGTEYTQEAVAYMMAKRDASMTHEVYPAIAAARDISWKSVERAMRYALRQAEESPNFDAYWRQQLGAWKDPTVHAVVRRVARWARAD